MSYFHSLAFSGTMEKVKSLLYISNYENDF